MARVETTAEERSVRFPKRVVKTLLWMRISWLALRAYRSPRRTISVLRRMIAKRAKFQRLVTEKYARSSGRYFWNFYSPGSPSRAFDRHVEHELDSIKPFRGGPPTLQTAIFAITKRCPLQCEHCCEWTVLNNTERLSEADLIAIVERVRVRGVAQLLLSGGEPLRRFQDLLAVVELGSKDTDVWILSSGIGLSEDRAAHLRMAGLTGVALSLDHCDAASHDRFRGFEGAYQWVERGAENARRADLIVALTLCPTRAFVSTENLDRYTDTARRIGASFIQILEPGPVGHYAGSDVALTSAQQHVLGIRGPAQFRSCLSRFSSRCLSRLCHAEHRRVGAGDRYIYIDTDGALHPCPFCRVPVGNALQATSTRTSGHFRAGCPARADEALSCTRRAGS